MDRLIRNLIPVRIRIFLNQQKNRKNFDVRFGKGATASLTCFEGKNLVNDYSSISESFVGLASYISGNCTLRKIKIGRFCSIGQNVQNEFSLHPSKDFVSTHPAFFSPKKQAGFTFVNKPIFKENKFADDVEKFYSIIGNDVWIGNDVRILGGITVGDGAIIAAGSVVTKDVKPYEIVGGVPAKHIRFRFNEREINFLMNLKWWNKDFGWISKNSNFFSSVEKFVEEFKAE